MTNIITAQRKFMLYNKRQHQKRPVPRPLQLKPIGHVLSEYEWKKFLKKTLIPTKLQNFCERSGHGDLIFFGEDGIEGALFLQEKFKGRFKFYMHCSSRETAIIALALAKEIGLKILEVSYRENRNHERNINDPVALDALAEEGRYRLHETNVKLA